MNVLLLILPFLMSTDGHHHGDEHHKEKGSKGGRWRSHKEEDWRSRKDRDQSDWGEKGSSKGDTWRSDEEWKRSNDEEWSSSHDRKRKSREEWDHAEKEDGKRDRHHKDSKKKEHWGHKKSRKHRHTEGFDLDRVKPNLDIEVVPDEYTQHLVEIDQQQRAQDFEEAFKAMKQQNPDGRVYAIVSGASIEPIVGVRSINNNTLVILTIEQGNRYENRTVKAEEIETLGQRGKKRSPVRRPAGW